MTNNPKNWSTDQVLSWLLRVSLGEYIDQFRSNHVTGIDLAEMKNEDFVQLGVTTFGHRRMLRRELNKLFPKEASTSSSSSARSRAISAKIANIKAQDITFHGEEPEGEGNFGEVYRGKYQGSIDVALKCLHEDNLASLGKEALLLQQMRHPNIVRFFGLCHKEGTYYMVTEWANHGSVQDDLVDEDAPLSTTQLISWPCDTARAMMYASELSPPVLHRDLSARNLLLHKLDGKTKCQVCDFGLARVGEYRDMYYKPQKSAEIPYRSTAPEGLEKNKFSTKSDVWSFGVLLWEMFSYGKIPYSRQNLHDAEAILDKLEDGFRLPKPKDCPAAVYELMNSCWKWKSAERPTFRQVYHKLFELHQEYVKVVSDSEDEITDDVKDEMVISPYSSDFSTTQYSSFTVEEKGYSPHSAKTAAYSPQIQSNSPKISVNELPDEIINQLAIKLDYDQDTSRNWWALANCYYGPVPLSLRPEGQRTRALFKSLSNSDHLGFYTIARLAYNLTTIGRIFGWRIGR